MFQFSEDVGKSITARASELSSILINTRRDSNFSRTQEGRRKCARVESQTNASLTYRQLPGTHFQIRLAPKTARKRQGKEQSKLMSYILPVSFNSSNYCGRSELTRVSERYTSSTRVENCKCNESGRGDAISPHSFAEIWTGRGIIRKTALILQAKMETA